MQYKLFENANFLLHYDVIFQKWYIKNKLQGDECDLSLTDNLSCFLQVFYEDPQIFLTDLLKKAKEENLDERIIGTLPFKKSIIFCIENTMFFWLELSLQWFEFISVDNELKKAIETVITDLKSPQNIRHRLRKIITKSHKAAE